MPQGKSLWHLSGQNSKNNSIYHEAGPKEGYKVKLNGHNVERIIIDRDHSFLFVEFICPKCEQLLTWLPGEYNGSRPSTKKDIKEKYGLEKRNKCLCNYEWSVDLTARAKRL